MFDNKSKTDKLFRKDIVTTEKLRVRNVKRFVLSNDETIIYKGKDRNWNFEIFKMLFQYI